MNLNANSARRAIAAIFFCHGCAFGAFAAHLPAFKTALHLSNSQVSVALLGMVAGNMLAAFLAGRLVVRVGSRRLTASAAVASAAALAVFGFPSTLLTLTGATAAFGFIRGFVNVGMNANGVGLQRDLGRPILSSFHAWFSLGGFAGSALTSVLFFLPGAEAQLAIVAGVLVVAAAIASQSLYPDIVAGAANETRARPSVGNALALLGFAALFGMISEGAMSDWSAIYLHTVALATPHVAVFGYAAFSFAMMIGRFTGDRLVARLQPARVVGFGGCIAASGLILALAVPNPGVAILGFAIVGLGLANIVPLLFGAAARLAGNGSGIATVSLLGYLGFTIGPPLIGTLSDHVGLRSALLVVVVSLASLAAFARVVAASDSPVRPHSRRTPARAEVVT